MTPLIISVLGQYGHLISSHVSEIHSFSVATLPSCIAMHPVRSGPAFDQSHTGFHGSNSNLHGCPGFIQGVICSELGAHTM